MKARSDRAFLLQLLDEAYDHKAWHGPNLKGSIRGLTATQAAWRPGPGRKSVADIVVHCAYWKFMVRKRITGDKGLSFPLPGRNWFALPAKLTSKEWKRYVALLEAEHRALREAVRTLPDAQVTVLNNRTVQGPANQIYGVALHDTYHAGQIRHLRALVRTR